MADSVVQLIFQAVDRASSTVNQLDARLNNLQSTSNATNSVLQGFAVGAGMAAFNALVNTATAGMNALGDAISRGADKQAQLINDAGGFAAILGSDMASATNWMREMNAELEKSVAALPGATAGFIELANGIADNLIPGAVDLKGALDMGKLNKLTQEFATIYGIIGQGMGVDVTNILKPLQRGLAGGALGNISNLQLFESGTGAKVIEEVKKQLAAQGKKDLSELSEKARVELFLAAGKKFVTDEYLEAASATWKGTMEGIASAWDKMTDTSRLLTSRNNMSVLDAATDVVTSLMDIFNKVVKTVGSVLGIEITDETVLATAFDGLKAAAGFIDSITASINPEQIIGFFEGVKTFFDTIGNFVSTDRLGNLGYIISDSFNLGTKIGEALGAWIESVDWASVLVDLGQILVAVAAFAAAFAAGFLSALGASLVTVGDSLIETFNSGMSGLTITVSETLSPIWATISETFTSGFQGIGLTISEQVTGLVETATGLAQNLYDTIANALSKVINGIKDAISNKINALESVINSVKSTIDSVVNAANTVKSTVEGLLSKLTGAQQSANSSASNAQNAAYRPVSFGGTSSAFATGSTANYNSPTFNVYMNVDGNASAATNASNILDELNRQWRGYAAARMA